MKRKTETTMRELKIKRNGWDYTVWVDGGDAITHIACARRFPKTLVKLVGDDWLVADLQWAVREILDA